MLKTRREFLLRGLGALGACLLPVRIAKAIANAAQSNVSYLVPLPRSRVTLFANNPGKGPFTLSLDQTIQDSYIHSITWGQWLDFRGIEPSDLKRVRQAAIDARVFHPEWQDTFVPPGLDETAPEHLFERYYESNAFPDPARDAYHYLAELPLADRAVVGKDGLGELSFHDGVSPGNDSCLVTAQGIATLGCLQQRLFTLGREVRIEIVPS